MPPSPARMRRRRAAAIAVLAGPGNNGGDGFVAARLLQDAGYRCRVFLLGDRERAEGRRERSWRGNGPVRSKRPRRRLRHGADLIIDALFGAGLDRPVEGEAARGDRRRQRERRADPRGRPAERHRRRAPARSSAGRSAPRDRHVLPPQAGPSAVARPDARRRGRRVADIGIDPSCLRRDPADDLPQQPAALAATTCRGRGSTATSTTAATPRRVGAADRTGAARLAARGALRVGPAWSPSPRPPTRSSSTPRTSPRSCSLRLDEAEGLAEILADRRQERRRPRPGPRRRRRDRGAGRAALGSAAAVVLDADALTSFADEPGARCSR